MKKLFVFALTAFLLAACGGGDTPDSLVKQVMREAEKKIPSEETPHLGKLPVLWAQYAEAKNMLDGMIKMQVMEAHANFKKDGKKDENVMDALEKLSEAKEELKQIFQEKIIAEAIKLEGHTIPADFDKSVFSDAKVIIHLSEDTIMNAPINLYTDLTLATTLSNDWWVDVEWESRDKDNTKIEYYLYGSEGIDEARKYKKGDHVTFNIHPIAVDYADIEKAKIFEKLYFSEKE